MTRSPTTTLAVDSGKTAGFLPSVFNFYAAQPLLQLHSDFGNCNDGVCRVMKITIAETNPVVVLVTIIML